MKILTHKAIKSFFLAISVVIGIFLVLSGLIIWSEYQTVAPVLLALCLLATVGIMSVCYRHFYKQNIIIAAAADQMHCYLAGNTNARIACDDEGELYKLFHVVNTLAAVLNAHAENELHFAYRAKQEEKEIILSGADDMMLFCDHVWMIEAISNMIKNALDHINPNGQVRVEWKQLVALTQITIKDDGNGIHPEDIHHIFKRFYRSRFSQDKQGLGLGLSLTKAIIEAHDGTITADSILGQGSTFTITFLNPT